MKIKIAMLPIASFLVFTIFFKLLMFFLLGFKEHLGAVWIGFGFYMVLATPQKKMGILLIAGGAIAYIAKHLKIKAAFSQTALGNINNIINETLDGIRIIKLFTAQGKMRDKFDEEVKDYGRQNLSMYKRFELSNPLSEFLSIATVAIILLIGGGMVPVSYTHLRAHET